MKKPFRTPPSPTQAIAQSDVEVSLDSEIVFSCKKGDTVKFKEIKYDEKGNGHLVIKDGVEVMLSAFKII